MSIEAAEARVSYRWSTDADEVRFERMSWEDFLALRDVERAEWVAGEVIVTPPVRFDHGEGAGGLLVALRAGLPGLRVVGEVGLALAGDRMRAPDLMAVRARPAEWCVTETPVLVAEVLSPSTRTEDLVRKSAEYVAAGIGQYWVLDPEARVLEVFVNVEQRWERLVRLDDRAPTGVVEVGEHGTVPIDLRELLPA